jgi:hypothetical protein
MGDNLVFCKANRSNQLPHSAEAVCVHISLLGYYYCSNHDTFGCLWFAHARQIMCQLRARHEVGGRHTLKIVDIIGTGAALNRCPQQRKRYGLIAKSSPTNWSPVLMLRLLKPQLRFKQLPRWSAPVRLRPATANLVPGSWRRSELFTTSAIRKGESVGESGEKQTGHVEELPNEGILWFDSELRKGLLVD